MIAEWNYCTHLVILMTRAGSTISTYIIKLTRIMNAQATDIQENFCLYHKHSTRASHLKIKCSQVTAAYPNLHGMQLRTLLLNFHEFTFTHEQVDWEDTKKYAIVIEQIHYLSYWRRDTIHYDALQGAHKGLHYPLTFSILKIQLQSNFTVRLVM